MHKSLINYFSKTNRVDDRFCAPCDRCIHNTKSVDSFPCRCCSVPEEGIRGWFIRKFKRG